MTTDNSRGARLFDVGYRRLADEGGQHKLHSLLGDKLGLVLYEICSMQSCGPSLGSISAADMAFGSQINGVPAIVYTFYYNPRSIAENAMLVLVRTAEDRVRLFTLETHVGKYYLCEFSEGRHMNYGPIDIEKLFEHIAKIIGI